MRDGTEIRKQTEVTMKIGKGETETGKKEIANFTVCVHNTSEINGTEALRGK